MNLSSLPNAITILRIILVLPVVVALLNEHYGIALLLFGVAGVSDGLDGYIAKHYHCTSRLGSILDPLADKLLLVSTYLSLAWLGLLPWWLVLIVMARDLMIVAGGFAYHRVIGEYEMSPSYISKLNTAAQILLGFLVVLSMSLLPLSEQWIDGLIYFVLATTLLSGADYLWTWGRRAISARAVNTQNRND
ncbi:MAG TPA: CDP-alcohol phosphatidyltransferase family protein [Chromatiales bacterium]|nr:CDP-alcohol phosphatidyltransferase family protein [Chromatiales bacterium]